MICSRCGYSNKLECRFCIKCGLKLYNGTTGDIRVTGELGIGSPLQNRYKVVKKIGKGGMGVVYLASDNRFSNRVCVVKEMIEYLANENEEERQKEIIRFNQEADLLATINHPNVPQVYDRFSEGSRHYLIMEYVEGADLRDLLNDYIRIYGSPLPEEEVVIYFMQLCVTLKYLHGHKPPILHRDIKPPNILLTTQGKIKLVDFGIAKTMQYKNQGTSIGTQGYAAPEQYKGFADERTDIYALGATIHHLLSGRDPQQETPFDYPPVIDLNNKVSSEISQIIQWMLEMNSSRRPENIDVVMESIKSVYSDIERRLLKYSIANYEILDIINKKLELKKQAIVMNICPTCRHENKVTSKFCIKCGSPVGDSGRFASS